MFLDKNRLYLALYRRGGRSKMPGGEDRFHWALLIGPKKEDKKSKGRRLHAVERISNLEGEGHTNWEFESRAVGMEATATILVRVLIAKINDMNRTIAILESIPIRGEQDGWNCVGWVKEAMETLQKDEKALGTARTDWPTVRQTALSYVNKKISEHRFDGKATPGQFDMSKVATFDLLEGGGSETIP
ncbi:hypothetical protein H0H93_003234 [Arthromyces matolae]|nr:hypothetical protein H0H93_003234 [Arthromyces matolae]